MKCSKARKMLVDYVNKALSQSESRLVQEHVVKCESCHQELGKLRKVLELIGNVKVEYPPASVWENFLPDLHSRIETEAALSFKRQRKQSLYLLPGWAASVTVILLILFASMIMRYNTSNQATQITKSVNVDTVVDSSSEEGKDSSEPVLVAGMISKVLISESEAAELRELKSFLQSETSALQDYIYSGNYSGGHTIDMEWEAIDTGNDEGLIEYLLQNGFEEFGERSMIESEDGELGTM